MDQVTAIETKRKTKVSIDKCELFKKAKANNEHRVSD